MITITLDEQGDFEYLAEKDTKPIFIGGVLYDDKGFQTDFRNEEQRLDCYFSTVCKSVGAHYPEDMHFSDKKKNGRKVALVKSKITETLREFLEKGTFEGKSVVNGLDPRKGKYYLFAYLKSVEGKEELLKRGVSSLVKEDIASNLYLHMAEDIVRKLVFHNPVIEQMNSFSLDLATRRVVLDESMKPKCAEYRNLGFREDEKFRGTGKVHFPLTNPSIYRTAVEREMLQTEKHQLKMEAFHVRSIYYESHKQQMAFLYLADVVCSILGFQVNADSTEERIKAFDERFEKMIGPDGKILFLYDSVDNDYDKAVRFMEDQQYFEALSKLYDGMQRNSKAALFYEKTWFEKLKEQMINKKNRTAFLTAIKKLDEYAHQSNIDRARLLYLFENLRQLGEQITANDSLWGNVIYDLFDTGISAFSHQGDSKRARECYEKCMNYSTNVEVEKYLRTRNKMVVRLCDEGNFEKAYIIAKENLEYSLLVKNVKMKLNQDEPKPSYRLVGIAKSQLGQVCAFLGKEEAKEQFVEALSEMEKDSPDYWITDSYLLHYYIEAEQKEAYDQEIAKFFEGKTGYVNQLKQIYQNVEHDSRISASFALYLYLKGLYYFHMDEVTEELWKNLAKIEEKMKELLSNQKDQFYGHPWQMIYKYLAFISYRIEKKQEAASYMEMATKAVKGMSPLLDQIAKQGEVEFEAVKAGTWKNSAFELRYMYR